MITTVQTIPTLRVAPVSSRNGVSRPWDRMLGELLPLVSPATQLRTAPEASAFAMDLAETDDRFVLSVDLPRVAIEDVELNIEGDVLGLRARRAAVAPEGASLLRGEIVPGELAQTLSLPGPVDAEAISATLGGGVLTVTMPKAQPAARRAIAITAS